MLYHHLKIIWRNFLKHKGIGSINLLGLTIGLATAMLIGIYVYNEWQTDKWIPQPERTFRLLRQSDINNEPYLIGVTSPPFATSLKQDYPEDVTETVRVLDGNSLVTIEDKKFQEPNYYYVDPNFLTFFDFPLLYGDRKNALSNANSIVLTLETAQKYFGDEKLAIGKTLKIDNDYDAIITGVLAKLEHPSHLNFDIIESNIGLRDANWWSGWWNNMLCTYFRLNPNVSAEHFENRLPQFMDKYFGRDFARTGTRIDLQLEPIRSVYFNADTRYDPMRHGNKNAMLIFLFAALLLVIIACANYVNLSTAKALGRNKEIGVLKVLGSSRKSIFGQMLGESFLFTTIATLLAVQLSLICLPYFQEFFNIDLSINLPLVPAICILGGLVLLVSLAAGSYPGIFLSSFKPINALKGAKVSGKNYSTGIRKSLVVFQFMLSISLLSSTFLVQQQLDFMQKKNLGFDKDHILIMALSSPEISNNTERFRQELKNNPSIKNVTFTSGTPGGFHDATSLDVPELNQSIRMRTAFVDFEYVDVFGLELIEGRNFDPRLTIDSTQSVLMNEKAAADLGILPHELLGKKVLLSSFDTISRQVIGVVKDYHFTSLHNKIEPLVISMGGFGSNNAAIKINGNNIPQAISAVEETWTNQASDFPFNYQFLDDRLDRLYQSETRQGRIFSVFAMIAIFIACLGMFGLAAFAVSARTKEIGIRKVLGASISSIIALLSKDFLQLVGLAFLIAIPFAWYFMDDWLNGFAYRIDIRWWVFLTVGLTALSIAFLTVSFQSIKAALANPINSLKEE